MSAWIVRGTVVAHVHSGTDTLDVKLKVLYNLSVRQFHVELPNGDWFQVTKELMDDVYRETRTEPGEG